MSNYRSHVMVCGGENCDTSRSDKLIETLNKQLAAYKLVEHVKVIRTGCFDICDSCPIMIIWYMQGRL